MLPRAFFACGNSYSELPPIRTAAAAIYPSRRAAFVCFVALLAGMYRTVCAVPLLDLLWRCWPDGTGRFVPCHFWVLRGVARRGKMFRFLGPFVPRMPTRSAVEIVFWGWGSRFHGVWERAMIAAPSRRGFGAGCDSNPLFPTSDLKTFFPLPKSHLGRDWPTTRREQP